MISRITINRIIAAALLLAAIYLVLSIMRVFRGETGWMEYSIIGVACSLIFLAAFLKLRRRAESSREVKSSSDSLLKHLWELRHKREW